MMLLFSGVTKEAVLREGRYQTVWMEAGVPGETTTNVHGLVVEESRSQKDTVIIHGMSMI